MNEKWSLIQTQAAGLQGPAPHQGAEVAAQSPIA